MSIKMRFSANLGFLFRESSNIVEQYRFAKLAGFSAVEHPFPDNQINHDELLAVKIENKLEVALVNIELDDAKFGCASLPNKIDDFRKRLENTVKFAKKFDCKKIHLMSGKLESPATNENRETFISNLKYAASVLEKEGIIGVIEPINNYSVPGYFLRDYTFAIDAIKNVGSNNIKLMVDIFHLQMIQGNITNSLKDFAPYIGHIQIAQSPNRNEPNTEGELNYKYILSEISKIGYDGYIGLEYKPLTKTVEGLKWLKEFGLEL
ncbi:putative hydroxypyruvate isomerase [Chironomus tepperi]|uniref:putative hydroxypyruvate isomerase n=1 Tax=Chironomus tepperi TaxID=113505 RepID=UPI00391FB51F